MLIIIISLCKQHEIYNFVAANEIEFKIDIITSKRFDKNIFIALVLQLIFFFDVSVVVISKLVSSKSLRSFLYVSIGSLGHLCK